MTKVIKTTLLLVWCLVGVVNDGSAQLATGEKDTISVGLVKVAGSVSDSAAQRGKADSLRRVAEVLRSEFIGAINSTRVFQIVERERVEELQSEQAFANSGMVADDKNAAKIGEMAGVKFSFMPEVNGFEDATATTNYQQIGRTTVNRTLFLSATVRIVDNTTGAILPESPSFQLKKSEGVEMARAGTTVNSDEIIVKLAKEMAAKLSQDVVSLLRPAKILTITGSQIMINRGTEAGFIPGVLLEYYATENIVDDDTGESFANEVPVGKGSVIRADAKKSFANINGENLGVAKGNVVRIIASPAANKGSADSKVKKTRSKTQAMTAGSSEKPWKY